MSVKMKPNDLAYWMLFDGVESTPVVHSDTCYICNDNEYARMGLPLCRECPFCRGHVPADDDTCDDCGECDHPDNPKLQELAETEVKSTSPAPGAGAGGRA